jgi:glutamate/tyrosine decarboxylase-like PLP-dependent enzyme
LSPIDTQLPTRGRSREAILGQLRELAAADPDYARGRTWSLVYYLGEEHTRLLEEAHRLFFSANALNPMAFKSLKRLEHAVVRMTADLLHGGPRACGTMTSGGTESCLLAVKTYRDRARARTPWIRRPEMILPESAHVAWEKGAEYFGVKAVHAPLMDDFRVDPQAVARRVGRNTVMILGSAPQYPHGVVDPIEELGRIAQDREIPLHVDACVGGYLLPFVERLGRPVPPFDFRVPGVASISADTHKYGYAAKGASVILYRDPGFLKHQLFVYENWPGGLFGSAGLLGTRPGGAIAAAWASMAAMGEDGYLENARRIMEATDRLTAGIDAIPGLAVLGRPPMSLFAYRAADPALNIFAVGDRLEARGWHVDRQQRPDCLHAMVTPRHLEVVPEFLADLAAAVDEVRADPALGAAGSAPMYGLAGHLPLRGLVRQNLLQTMLAFYGPEGRFPALGADGAGDAHAPAGGAEALAARALGWWSRWKRRRAQRAG